METSTITKVVLLVEGITDKEVVSHILTAANFSIDKIEIIICNGKNQIKEQIEKHIKEYLQAPHTYLVFLRDSNEIFVSNARKQARQEFGEDSILEKHNIEIFFAVEEIESWILADKDLLLKFAKSPDAITRIQNLPLPEEIMYPSFVLNKLIGYKEGKTDLSFLREINIVNACARNQSLKDFLVGMGRILGVEIPHIEEATALNMNLKIFSNLLKEVYERETIVYRTMSGYTYSAADLVQQVEDGTQLGKDYVADLLRMSRDFMIRKANRSTS